MRRNVWGLATALVLAPALQAAELKREADPETGLVSWKWQGEVLSLELVQRLPDQSRAFFLGRGFGRDNADAIAGACIFQTILRNVAPAGSDTELSVDLGTWRVETAEGTRPPRLEGDWEARWERTGAPNSARIAFRWSLFPTTQAFRPDDYNWGMIPFGPPPGTEFDLHVAWREDGASRSARMEGLRCAPDVARLKNEETE